MRCFDFFSNSSDLKRMKTSSKNLTAAQRLALGWIQNVNVIAGFLSTPCHSFYPGFAQRCMPPVLALLKRNPLMARQVLDVSIAGLLQKCRRVFSFTSSPNFCPSPASAANRLTIPAGCSEVDPTSLGQEQPQQPRVLRRQRRSRQLGACSGQPTQPHSRLATHNLGCDNSSHHLSCCTSNTNSQMPH